MKEIKKSSYVFRLHRFSMIELLIALVLLFVITPVVEELKGGGVVVSVLFSLVLLSAVVAVANSSRTLAVALLFAIPALAGRWINDFQPSIVSAALFLVPGIGLVAFVIFTLLRFILAAPSVNNQVLCASVSAYVMLGLIWAMAYWLIQVLSPGAFAFNTTTRTKEAVEGFNSFYFSLTTLSTLGYGDITPVSKMARSLASLESITGLLYVAVLIARLVGLYSRPTKPNTPPRDDSGCATLKQGGQG